MTTRQNIEKTLWNACDSFRGKIDSSRYKDYILSMLFVKYLSDVYVETRETYMKQYDGDERRVERAMSRERFVMDETSTFASIQIATTLKSDRKSTLHLPQLKTITAQNCITCSVRSILTLPLISVSRKRKTPYLRICWKTSKT